ncbi:hypothetical protein [Cellulosimicrobium cellulans]|uniref:YrhK domain-containing protein n=1 Tax=Cellulosimicrobium cellulans TaxID=1710 RepID=A0A4Y4E0Y6_CELCE|nr:hypothetical protein [Cellulosimicrobium cellulans]GED09290.1 hypothetical protein CCE02nite_12890 [Cellulosimicrobium cellulans]
MSEAIITAPVRPRPFLVPTLTKQCWGFMIGSSLFAVGSAPGFESWAGSSVANLLYFVGALFFTAAGFAQLLLSGAVSVPVRYAPGRMVRAEWLTAATQSFGTIMFNVSTTAALYARSRHAETEYVWNPDAAGSLAFLVSANLAFVAYVRGGATWWDPRRIGWWSVVVNFVGCAAFAVSAVGAFVLPGGSAISSSLANGGTFVGALCFFVASLVVLPWWSRQRASDVAGAAVGRERSPGPGPSDRD